MFKHKMFKCSNAQKKTMDNQGIELAGKANF